MNTEDPPPILSYATPLPVALPDTVPFGKPADDPGPFCWIGRLFSVNGVLWRGPVVASAKAFYLVKRRKSSGFGGAVWRVGRDCRSCDVMELPPQAREALGGDDWPSGTSAIVIPIPAASRIRVPRLNNKITVEAGADCFGIATAFFSNGRIRRFLLQNGCGINRPLTPDAGPIPGPGSGARRRSQEEELFYAMWLALAVVALLLLFKSILL